MKPIALLWFLGVASSSPELHVRGIVVDPSRNPVAGATVIATAVAEEPVITDTGQDGRFELAVESVNRLRLVVIARGYATWTAHEADAGEPLEIVLRPGGGVLRGWVRDGDSLDPIVGAVVEAQDPRVPVSGPSRPRLGILETTSDANGAFRIEGLGDGPWSARVSAPGYGSATRTLTPSDDAVELFLFPGAGIYGSVVDIEGAGVAGVTVSATRTDRAWFDPGRDPSPQRSDADGRFALLGVAPGSYRLVARHPDSAPSIVPEVRMEAMLDVEVEIPMTEGTSIKGRIIDEEERPMSGGSVSIDTVDGQRLYEGVRPLVKSETDAQGYFTLERVPEGEYELLVKAPGYAAKRVSGYAGGTEDEELGDIVLETGNVIRGRVIDSESTPIGGARVTAFRKWPDPPRFEPRQDRPVAETADDGTFSLRGLDEGKYQVFASAPGYGSKTHGKTVQTGESVELFLSPAGSVTGVVVDDKGSPITDFDVLVRDGNQTVGIRNTSDAGDGSFLLEDLTEGEYTVQIEARGFEPGVVSGVTLTRGATTDVGSIHLSRGGVVRGIVVEPSGAPVAGAHVRAEIPGQHTFSRRDESVLGGANGSFEIAGLPRGRSVELTASHPTYADGRTRVTVSESATEARAEIRLTFGGRIEGRVRGRGGVGIPGRTVLVMPTVRAPTPSLEATTDLEGRFFIERVPAGPARVLLTESSPTEQYSVESRAVEVVDGETVTVELDSIPVLVRGRVTKNGMPLARVTILLRGDDDWGFRTTGPRGLGSPAPGPLTNRAITGEDGFYELLADRPGNYRVRVEGTETGLPQRTVAIPDVDVFDLDLDYGGAPLDGIVVDAETKAPLSGGSVSAQKIGARGESVWTETDQGGRFELELTPGRYTLTVRANGYGTRTRKFSIGAEGVSDVVMALAHGRSLEGFVRDVNGRGLENVGVRAVADIPDTVTAPTWGAYARSLPDGSFHLADLPKGRFNVIAAHDELGFAFLQGAQPGTDDLELVLRPGGKLTVVVRDAAGVPVEGAIVAVIALQGRRFRGVQDRTDANGITEIRVPAGDLQLKSVHGTELQGLGSASVSPGDRVTSEIVLRPLSRDDDFP